MRKKKKSQEWLEVHLQGRAGHGQLKAFYDVWVKDSKMAYALPSHKDLSAPTGEKDGIWKKTKIIVQECLNSFN